jgi:serine/threonine-protein kinase
MGEIYEATHLRLAGRYAIKLLRPEIADNADALARFEREARVTSALRHPNIVQVVDFSALPGGAPFMVMEFLEGLELAQMIKRTGRVALPRVAALVRQIAAGLTAAHDSGVVHRDLKPQNIFVLDVVGHESELVKIVDFGISKVRDLSSTITGPSALMGTVQYMSPEQARGRIDDIDARTDQFALAAIVYEMLVGAHAFTGDGVSSVLYQIVHEEPAELVNPLGVIPPAIATVLRRGLSKDKESRYPTVLAFSAALEGASSAGAAASATTLAEKRTASGPLPAAPRSSRKRAAWVMAGSAALACGWYVLRVPRSHGTSGAGPALTAPARTSQVSAAPSVEESRQKPPEVAPALEAAEAPAPPRSAADKSHGVNPARADARPRATHHATSIAMKPAPAIAPAPLVNCDPNFYFDSKGSKHFKPECFLNEKARP